MRHVSTRTTYLASMTALVLGATLLAVPASAHADEVGGWRTFGIGLVVGYPDVGLSINFFLSRATSIQIDPLIHFHHDYGNDNGHGAIGGRVDLLFWMPTLASWPAADLGWYWGPGANLGIGLGDNGFFGLGAELPVGIGLRFHGAPIDLNIEAVPVLHLIQDVDFGIGAALDARYYF